MVYPRGDMGSHTTDTRRRLARLVRRADADLAEAALLVNAEAMPDLDVDIALLRIDALADAFRVWWDDHDRLEAAAALTGFLAEEQGFTGRRVTNLDKAIPRHQKALLIIAFIAQRTEFRRAVKVGQANAIIIKLLPE